MNDQENTAYSQIEAGFEFPPGDYSPDASTVSLFLKATDDTSPLYRNTGLVPPMVVAASAMATLSKTIKFPPGSIHVSQELEFIDTVSVGEKLTSNARISRTQKRGKLHLLTVDFVVRNQNERTVLTGKTSFILPQQDTGE